MKQILLVYGVSKEIVRDIIMTNTKVMVWSLNGDTDFFDIITGTLQGDILVPYLL